jgi:hypothetical protein
VKKQHEGLQLVKKDFEVLKKVEKGKNFGRKS